MVLRRNLNEDGFTKDSIMVSALRKPSPSIQVVLNCLLYDRLAPIGHLGKKQIASELLFLSFFRRLTGEKGNAEKDWQAFLETVDLKCYTLCTYTKLPFNGNEEGEK